MNNIGLIIKMSRIQQNMKQITLAKGICSTSYLSKIENNQTIPSEDIIVLLLNRLNLNLNDFSTGDEESLIDNLFTLYRETIIERKKEEIQSKLNLLTKKSLLFKSSKNYYLYNLYIVRILLIVESSSEKPEKLLHGLDQMKDNFDERQSFIFFFNYGLYYYLNKDYKKSLTNLEAALKFITSFHIEDWESADFFNVLSLAYLANNHLLNTIKFATKSLIIYRDMFIFKRAIDCYIVIGIANKKNSNYKHAEENFLLAQKIALDLNLTEYESLITHNLGSLSAVKGQSNLALKYYFKSLESSLTHEHSLTTIFCIIQEYSKKKNFVEVCVWCNKGLDLIETIQDPKLLSFYYHFRLYLAISKDIDTKEHILVETVLYFEKIEDYRHTHKYSLLLGNYYAEQRKYKSSSIYFQKASIYLYKLKSINTWEDL